MTDFPVVDVATGRVLKVPTANLMTDVAVKRSVPTPLGYAVDARAAGEIGALLTRHGIPCETLTAARKVPAETWTLLRVEEEFDDVYGRYGGRTIVKRGDVRETELAAGSLYVPLDGEAALRAAILLEPSAMYGLWQYPVFWALVAEDGGIPVLRVLKGAPPTVGASR